MYESSIVQHFTERGIQQGIQQGLQQGIRQGRLLSVLDVISERFSPNDAERLKPTLESIADVDLLRQVLVKASEAKTVSEFQGARSYSDFFHEQGERMSHIRQAPFALRIVQRKTGKAAIVYRRKADKDGRDRLQRVAAISPLAFTAATPLLREAVSRFDFDELRRVEFIETNPAENQKNLTLTVGPFHPLDADYGARVACFALIATGLRDGERLTRAANHLRHADPNEAAWWLGLLTRDDNARALRALRILTEAVQ